ncbi:MAG TPA: glycoside hydrolase family 4 [Phycisphaerae bacterium]|nr:glycoside hydrolase family 4 [Phycisphaerae bacterium]HUT56407.1 glycoside hydrolase family 4 [Phycisphaerae bacterium]
MRGPKITVIGAGSFFFGRPVIHKLATSPHLAGGTLALVDTDPKVLATMSRLARRIFRAARCGVKVVAATDRRRVMRDSDFIVLTFSYRNAHYRGIDTRIAATHGIRMCSSDTIGPGGIFRSLREVPHALAMACDAARLAPNAWIINFVNPTTVMGMALRRYAPDVRSFAICDGLHEPYVTLNWCKTAGILPRSATAVPPEVRSRLDLRIGGVNHCTWMTRFTHDGKDMMPAVRKDLLDRVRKEKANPGAGSKARYNAHYAMQLWDLYGAYPTCIAHTKEYVPFFQGYGAAQVRPEPIALFDADERAREMADAWALTERYAAGRLSAKHFLANVHDDHATDIIESMWGGLGKCFYVSSPNRGAATNLPADAYLELRCDVDMAGPRPQPFGELPRGLSALQQQILDTHELTAEAAVTCDRATLRRAMLTDPICNNIADADGCIADLLAAQRQALPARWFRRHGR